MFLKSHIGVLKADLEISLNDLSRLALLPVAYFIYFIARSLILKDFMVQLYSIITRILIATIYQGSLFYERHSICSLFIPYINLRKGAFSSILRSEEA